MWNRKMWRCELQDAVKTVLARGDMTATEISLELHKMFGILVPYTTLNAILKETRGVYVKCRVPSPFSKKMVILYTIGIILEMKK